MPYFWKEDAAYIKATVNRLESKIFEKVGEINITAYLTKEPVPYEARETGEKRTLKKGDEWGNLFDCAWMRLQGEIPACAQGKPVSLILDVNGEMCIFDQTGCPVRGLTNVNSVFDTSLGKPGKREYPLTQCAKAGETFDIWADCGCNDLFGNFPDPSPILEADIAIVHEAAKDLFYDFSLLMELERNIDEQSARRAKIQRALTLAAGCLMDYTDEEYAKARDILKVELDRKNGDSCLSVSAIGHAHIDLAWLWPIRETVRKGARTFATALANMEKYPDYIFGASQPQLYLWMKQYYPALYEKVRQKVREGRWEVQGCMWVEPDTNVTGGESLVRQILYGKRFFEQEFGIEVDNLWLPDVFGYSAALPQLLKKSGVNYFMTQKMSWSRINKFPHQTFLWSGLDNTKVLTHMLPEETYNSPLSPESLRKVETNFFDKAICDEALVLFGIGDGGAGPGETHLEYAKREGNLMGVPPMKQERAADFLHRQDRYQDQLKTWRGELYLEKHQGTYTSQARNKRFNRLMESRLHEAELWLSRLGGADYPREKLLDIWREVMLYQFHDILPGSSIARVYEESLERYGHLVQETEAMIADALKKLTGEGEKPLFVNALGFERGEWVKDVSGEWRFVRTGAFSVAEDAQDKAFQVAAGDGVLENELLKVCVDERGGISQIYDKQAGRTVLSGRGNALSLYADEGDAWDFNMDYGLSRRELSASSVEFEQDGPRAICHVRYAFGDSIIRQDIVLTSGSRRLDFETYVDWKEQARMLRVGFPVEVAPEEAVCDVQFGHLKRPAHQNTSWDAAKYEVCCQHFADLTEGDYGVALMSDCKYGYHIGEGLLDLNLLRASSYPGVKADVAEHRFTYSLYPHEGDVNQAGVLRQALALAQPMYAVKGGHGVQPLVQLNRDDVVVETVKRAEDDDALIVRLYESAGKQTGLSMKVLGAKQAQSVNLMEREETPVDLDALKLKPFEILTLKLRDC